MKKNRREFIKLAGAAGTGLVAGGIDPGKEAVAKPLSKASNRIVAENARAGTAEWQLQYTRFDDPITLVSNPLIRRVRSSMIEGYASKASVLPGESIDFMVSTNPGKPFKIDIYRMGYYGGTGGRHMETIGPFEGSPQPMPMMTIERLRECQWESATTFAVPTDWLSGIYLAKLSVTEPYGKQSYIIFVVKEHRKSDILCQVSDLTWQSYNKWPGRDSLYDDGTPEVWYTGPNVRVSFDRPYAKYCQILDAPLSVGSGEFLLWEHPMVYWLEEQGYDVTYCSNLDLHLDPAILGFSKVFLSIGHDEYWSRKMYEEAVKARNNGLSFAFFSGNSVYTEVIFYDSADGRPCRAFARDKRFPDEEKLMGLTSYGPGYGDWVVKNAAHWIYEGTGLKEGDKIPAMIGWEYHGPPLPDIEGLEIVAESPMHNASTENPHMGIIYPCPKGNWVFNAGTIWWTEGLSQPPGHIPAGHNPTMRTFGVNAHVQKITANLLNRMIKDSPL
ncbi:MAG TPA: N,N-dimethylformamidase beta subunit family domain-containing protein [Cyclobacteriaceae bacterium]|nr:N,N-dimethylformamidase beta subunit family domain-containing protein [Cyclobacteriaceae bacterium]